MTDQSQPSFGEDFGIAFCIEHFFLRYFGNLNLELRYY